MSRFTRRVEAAHPVPGCESRLHAPPLHSRLFWRSQPYEHFVLTARLRSRAQLGFELGDARMRGVARAFGLCALTFRLERALEG